MNMDTEFIWMLLEDSMLQLTLEVRIDKHVVGKDSWKIEELGRFKLKSFKLKRLKL